MNPPDDDRRRAILEQWWPGLLCLAVWVVCGVIFLRSCAKGGEVRLSWNPAPVAENVTSWRIWRGIEVLTTVTENRATLTLPDEVVTVTVTAVNAAGESDHTPPLTLYPITVQTSADLVTWHPWRVIHRSRRPAEFFRIKLEP